MLAPGDRRGNHRVMQVIRRRDVHDVHVGIVEQRLVIARSFSERRAPAPSRGPWRRSSVASATTSTKPSRRTASMWCGPTNPAPTRPIPMRRELTALVHHERVERIADGDEHVLAAVDHGRSGARCVMLPIRECHSGLPFVASKATKLPPASPVNTRSPAVASTPPASARAGHARKRHAARRPCRSCSRWPSDSWAPRRRWPPSFRRAPSSRADPDRSGTGC